MISFDHATEMTNRVSCCFKGGSCSSKENEADIPVS